VRIAALPNSDAGSVSILPVYLRRAENTRVNRPSVLIADDHPVLLEGVKTLVSKEFRIVAAVGDGQQVLKAVGKFRPDLVVLDVSMPNLNGIEATRALRKMFPDVKVVVLTMHSDPVFAAEALEAGALAYVLKASACSDLIQAMHSALRGRRFVSRDLGCDVPSSRGQLPGGAMEPALLSARQREVLQLIAEGRSLKEIAAQLNLSIKTVEFHKYRLCRTLGMHTTAELTAFAIRHGIVSS
jgi:DNA-binding NarL/FixJ family response regulator